MLEVETRWLFTVITSCEEVLMTTTETPMKKERYFNHEREAQDHIPGCGNGHHQSAVHTWTVYHWHMPFRFLICDQRLLPKLRSHAGSV